VEREMEKYSFVCTARLSLLRFLLLSFGERKVMVCIINAFDEKGYDIRSFISMVQEMVVKSSYF
jgi:hypothetical protein